MSDETKLPEEWADHFFPSTKTPMGGMKRAAGHAYARHTAAVAAHGWDVDAYHFGRARLRLSEADYLAALAAAGKVTRGGNPQRHPAAVPPNVKALCPALWVEPKAEPPKTKAETPKPDSRRIL